MKESENMSSCSRPNGEPHFHGSPPPGSAFTREDAESVCAAIAERNITRRKDYPGSEDLVVQIVPLR
jgi:hypothetical protein